MKYYIQSTYLDITHESVNCFHVSGIEPTEFQSLNELYKYIKKSLKGQIRKIYIDTRDGVSRHVGYSIKHDDGEKYLEEVWIELLEEIQVLETVTKYKAIGT